MVEIAYRSTNLVSKHVRFGEALLRGQADDKGLYTPIVIPRIHASEIAALRGMPYPEVAFHVTKKFLEGEIPEKELRRITKEAYNFDVPIRYVSDNRYVMGLDQGPTASFKDFAARMMSRLMQYYLKDELTILVATSGDTGSAMGSAFHKIDGINVVILFPKDEVSAKQRKQMTTLGNNITSLAVDGKFDDCQGLVKQAFSDPDLKALNLSSANSINIGRLLPQSVYYFYAHSRIGDESIGFSVPCGNFGNITGGLIAKRMGLPVERFISSVNENDEFPLFLESGKYQKIEPSWPCISNAMNVGSPNNLPRIFNFYGGQMDEKGNVIRMPDIQAMRKDIYSTSISDEVTRMIIKLAHKQYGLVLEPHGAVAWAGLHEYLLRNETETPFVSLETAHPAKFPEVISEAIGVIPKEPVSLSSLDGKTEKFGNLGTNYDEFKQLLVERIR